ncbi:MAG: hydrogenase expression/formation protein HypE [Bacteroidales bacterium]|nr:hydrogenase expression/formation protein HypE [Bacteroidales bacterium]MBN2818980.1 hydrogenase expression/formation protein HypE [Bacteroidales bacterium]
MSNQKILMGHGAGGKLSHQLIQRIFVRHFSNKSLSVLNDASVIKTSAFTAFTTDSYVIDPIFFPGGDIGKLAVSGTVNDLLVSGAVPKYLSAGFIIEEGFLIDDLVKIVASMADEARKAGVEIITGDTKVVKKGQCDKIFINTAGIGDAIESESKLWKTPKLRAGDKVIVSGCLGDHAMAVLSARSSISFEREVLSDVAPLNKLILPLYTNFPGKISFMRDVTRGGLATVLNEICADSELGIELFENKIPVRCEVEGVCEIFGYDPLYLANEGKVVIIVESETAEAILEQIKSCEFGKKAEIVGEINKRAPGRVIMNSVIGGTRIVDMLAGEMLPRIC